MRTTLTLDPDVAQMVENEAHRLRRPVKEIVNAALRRGLARGGAERPAKPFRVRAHQTGLVAGLDRGHLNALADEMEDGARLRRRRR
jgi:hypothetical protein